MRIHQVNLNYSCLYNVKNRKFANFAGTNHISSDIISFSANKEKKDYSDYDFVSASHVKFFKSQKSKNPDIDIIGMLEKISKMDRLEGHNKLNLTEHVIVKIMQGEKRDFDKLIEHIKYFSKNKNLNSVLIADSSKYILENPEVDRDGYNKVISFVVQNSDFKEPSIINKITKIIFQEKDKQNELFDLIKRGMGPSQIKFICSLSNDLANNLKNGTKFEDYDVTLLQEYFIKLHYSNKEIFKNNMKEVYPLFPKDEKEARETKKQLEVLLDKKSPLIYDESIIKNYLKTPKTERNNDKFIIDICKSIINSNIDTTEEKAGFYYKQKAIQSIYKLENLDLSYENHNKICKIITAYGELLGGKNNFAEISLLLRYRNSFELFKEVLKGNNDDCNSKKLDIIQKYIKFLKFNTNIIINDDFENENYEIMKFADGTVNKIVEYNEENKHNPLTIIHAAGIELAGIIPIAKNADKNAMLINANSNRIFSVSVLSEDDFKPFRTFGFVFLVDYEDILGGENYDMASGYDKDIKTYGAKLLESNPKILQFLPNLIKNLNNMSNEEYMDFIQLAIFGNINGQKDINNIESNIGATERIDGRKYNEFLVLTPFISGIYVYGDINSLPYSFRKFAQDNDLKILHIKNRKN